MRSPTFDRVYEVGKLYTVPVVKAVNHFTLGAGLLPVLGPKHEDAEFIAFPYQHWHIDFRFLSERMWKRVPSRWSHGDGACYATVIQEQGARSFDFIVDTAFGVQQRRMTCKRTLPTYPYRLAKWLPKLGAAFKDQKLKPGLICPHKGIPLAGCPRDGDVVTCPGHGLRWNVKTGSLVV